MVSEVSAVSFRRNVGELLSRVRERSGAVVISENGKEVAALVDAELFARIRRLQGRFDEVSRQIAIAHTDAPAGVGLAEIDRLVSEERAG